MTPEEQLNTATHAAKAAAEGRIDDARRGFADSLSGDSSNLQVLFLAFQFHFRIGELDEAERFVERRLDVIGRDTLSEDAGRAYSNQALIHIFRGTLDTAETLANKAINVDRSIRNEYGVSRDLHNLAMVHEARSELDRAEATYREALAIAERIGAEDLIATKLSNLGDIALQRGDVHIAREQWTRAVTIFERLGQTKGRDEYVRKLGELPIVPTKP